MARNRIALSAFGPMVLAAVEHNEPPERRLVDDDLAATFLPTYLRTFVAATRLASVRNVVVGASERSGPGLWASIACRKRLIDDRLSDPVNEFDAVVILGAGLDTRAYRIARHGALPVFEVDQQVNVDRKAAVVDKVLGAMPASVQLVAVDFEHDDLMSTLSKHGYDATQRTFFIMEGVTQYLSPDAVRATFEQLRNVQAGSRLIFTYIRQDFIDGVNLYGAQSLYRRFRKQHQVWQTGFVPEQLHETLAGYGWDLFEQAGPAYFRDTYIRPTGRRLSASQIEWSAHAIKT